MTTTIILTAAIITGLGLLLAVALYLVAQRFKVEEDPRIGQVEKAMPGANCGGCGFAGCHAFAEAAVKASNLDDHETGRIHPRLRSQGESAYGRGAPLRRHLREQACRQ